MKIIITDNYNRETVADFLVAENVREDFAEKICALLNKEEGENSPNFYKAVPDDYCLSKGMEDLF